MARILFFISCLIVSNAFACKCDKPIHSNEELDDYLFINSDIAVIVQVDSVLVEEHVQYAVIRVVDDLKGNAGINLSVASNTHSSCAIDLFALKGQKLLIIEDLNRGSTIELTKCSNYWIWYTEDDLSRGAVLEYGQLTRTRQRFNYVQQLKQSFAAGKSLTTYSNKVATSKGEFLNGKAEGKWIHYAFSDHVYTKGRYENGQKEGQWIVYHYGRETRKVGGHFMFTRRIVKTGFEKGQYVNGKRHGKWVFVDTTSKDRVVVYEYGVVVE